MSELSSTEERTLSGITSLGLSKLLINSQACTGCMMCELACSNENEAIFNPGRSRIKVIHLRHQGKFIPYTCLHCTEPWLMEVRSFSKNGALSRQCMECPRLGFDGKKSVPNCDLCNGDPACIKICPTDAITISRLADISNC